MKHDELRKELAAILEGEREEKAVKAGDLSIAAGFAGDEDKLYVVTGGLVLGTYWFPAFELVERPSGLGFDCKVSTDYPCDEELEDAVKSVVYAYNLKQYDYEEARNEG